jgi:hypothetical protein
MAILVLVCLGLASFPGWHNEEMEDGVSEKKVIQVRPVAPRRLVFACAIASGFSTTLLLISGLWQIVAAAAARSTISYTTYGVTKSHVGTVAMVLVWLAFLILLLVTVGLLVSILALRVLDNLENWSDSDEEADEESLLQSASRND